MRLTGTLLFFAAAFTAGSGSLTASATTTGRRTFPAQEVHTCVAAGVDVVAFATLGIGSALPGMSSSELSQAVHSVTVIGKALDTDREVVLPKLVRSAFGEMRDATIHEVAGIARATLDADRLAAVERLGNELKRHKKVVQGWFLDACSFLLAPACSNAANAADVSAFDSKAPFTTKRFIALIDAAVEAVRSNQACATTLTDILADLHAAPSGSRCPRSRITRSVEPEAPSGPYKIRVTCIDGWARADLVYVPADVTTSIFLKSGGGSWGYVTGFGRTNADPKRGLDDLGGMPRQTCLKLFPKERGICAPIGSD